MTSKPHLRKEAFQRLDRLVEAEKQEASAAIRGHLESWPVYQNSKCLLLFSGINNEPDLLPLLEGKTLMPELGEKTFCFPKVSGDAMEIYGVTDRDQLIAGRFGILEPSAAGASQIPVGRLDLILAPGVAFGQRGERLGRGGGYFDRFLPGLKPEVPIAGIGFGCQMFAAVPLEDHDVTMNFVITENGVKITD